MELSVNDIAKLVNGKVTGNGSAVVRGAAGLDEATSSDISFLRDEKKKDLLSKSNAVAVFVQKGFQSNGKTLIEVDSPIEAFAAVLNKIAVEKTPARLGVHPQAVIAPSAKIGKNVFIGPFCIIEENAQIGDDTCLLGNVYVGARCIIGNQTKIYPQVVLREDVKIGAHCIIHAGAVIGSDGYGFFFAKGRHNKIPQIGTVVIEDDVEIGSCTTIDRAMTGTTKIGQGTKIDNLVQVAHNVEIGPLSLLAAQVGIAGSTKLGKGVVFGGQSGVADHITISDGAQIGGQTGVIQNVEPGAILFGTPAQPIKNALQQALLLKRLPGLFSDVKKLKGNQNVGDKSANS